MRAVAHLGLQLAREGADQIVIATGSFSGAEARLRVYSIDAAGELQKRKVTMSLTIRPPFMFKIDS